MGVSRDLGASTGSRASTEPCSTVSALTGFDPERLLELAERCEQATEPSINLDKAIALGVGYLREPNDFYAPFLSVPPIPDYTASVDAAMRLASGFGGEVTFFKDGTAKAFLWQPYPMAVEAKAASPTLALCAAALRARAASAIEARSDETRSGSAEGESAASEAGDAQ